MNRTSTFVLIAAVAVTSIGAIFAGSATAQIRLPKISVPKIPKADSPATTSGSDPVKSTQDAASPNSSDDQKSAVRGKPIQGARIIFSSSPDRSNPKTTFASSEYIYGRADFGGRTMYDAFGWKAMGDRKFYYVSYWLKILPEGSNDGWEHDWHNGRNYTLVTKEEAQKTYWDFDVLPDPEKASTRVGAIADDLDYFKGVAGMWPQIRDMDNARNVFPKNGPYTVDMVIFGDSYDDWGKPAGNYETYPTVSAKLAFQFSGSDGQRLASGYEKAYDALRASKDKAEMLKAMPDWWAKGATPPEAKLTPARLTPMIKNYIGQWNLTYLKHMIYPFSGPVWAVEKNDLGIPRYRRMTSAIYIVYKDPKDSACKLGYLEMHEPYAGGGTYSEAVLTGISDIKMIDCAVVK